MNQNEREVLVDRYLSGQLSSAEESDFFLKVAVDPELQRTLKAFKIVDRVVERDRESVPVHGRYRDHVMSLIAATHVVAGGGAVASGIAQAQVGASVGSASAGVSGGAIAAGAFGLKGILAAIVGVGVVGSTLMIVLPSHDPVHPAGNDAVQQQGVVKDPPMRPTTPMPTVQPADNAITTTPSAVSAQASGSGAVSVPGRVGAGQRPRGAAVRTTTARPSLLDRATTYRRNPRTVLPDQTVVHERTPVQLEGPRSSDD